MLQELCLLRRLDIFKSFNQILGNVINYLQWSLNLIGNAFIGLN